MINKTKVSDESLKRLIEMTKVNVGQNVQEWDELYSVLLELVKYREKEFCKGCTEFGKWDDELEHGYNCPCLTCRRYCSDHYNSVE